MTDQPTVGDMMSAYAQDAVEHARAAFGVDLDFTPASVEHVETVLGKLYDATPRGVWARLIRRGPTEADKAQMAKMYGGYIGEVIRRTWGGHWELDHPVAGPRSFPIHWKGHQSFPLGWCFKRLKNGPEDNVWHKLQVLCMREGPDAAAP
jgi:hypothetical protein